MTDLSAALATIGSLITPEEQAQAIRDRQQALARAAHPLALDLGVLQSVDTSGMTDEQRQEHEQRVAATETQIVTIAGEIERLATVADVPLTDAPTAPSLADAVARVEAEQVALRDQVRTIGVALASAAGVPEEQAQAMIDAALTAPVDVPAEPAPAE